MTSWCIRLARPLCFYRHRQTLPVPAEIHRCLNLAMPAQINPGCMRSTIKAPISAMKDQFKTRDGLDNSATIDKTQHRKKVRVGIGQVQQGGKGLRPHARHHCRPALRMTPPSLIAAPAF